MRKITFTADAFREYNEWIKEDFETVEKIVYLLRDIQQSPFKGLRKPEPLKGNYAGCWSRRINHKDRLVYRTNQDNTEIIKCKGHY